MFYSHLDLLSCELLMQTEVWNGFLMLCKLGLPNAFEAKKWTQKF